MKNKVSQTAAQPQPVLQSVHPALHFEKDFAAIGVIDLTGQYRLVTSNRELVDHETWTARNVDPNPSDYPAIKGRWAQTDLDLWIKGQRGPSFRQTVRLIRTTMDSLIEFRRPEESALVTCWIVGTYLFPLFGAFPRLHLHAGPESGKTKLLQFIEATAFNGLLRINPTPAVLFRLIGPLRPTFCLDEMESLAGEDHRDIHSIFNNGYKKGGCVDRCVGDDHRVTPFEVFAPMAMAGIHGLNSVMESRAISLLMERGRVDEKVNRSVDSQSPVYAPIRTSCYRLALSRFQQVISTKKTVPMPAWLRARQRELFHPLMTIAWLADDRKKGPLTEAVQSLAQQDSQHRSAPSFPDEAVYAACRISLNGGPCANIRPGELIERVERALGRRLTAEGIGHILKRSGFERNRDDGGTFYKVTDRRLNELTGTTTAS